MRPRNSYLASANAAIEPRPTARAVARMAITALFSTFCQNDAVVRIVP